MRTIHLLGVSGLAVALIQAPLQAQTAVAAQQNDPTGLPTTPTKTTADDTLSDAQVADIIVTAQRRTSTSQRTPATLEVLGGSELRERGVASIDDALSTVSGVFVQSNNKGVNINVRGVGTTLDSTAGDPGVNTNIDGVYIRQASAVASGLYDLERIEVLKGPQGTLYGRNATGGVVNILTADPTQELSARGSVTIGNYSQIRTDAALNVPLSDTLAMRAAFGSDSRDGFYNTGQDDAQRVGARIKLLWKPIEDLRILTGASFSHDGGIGPGSISVSEPRGSRQAVAGGEDGHLDQKVVTVFSNAEWNAGPVVVTFIPTFSRYIYDSNGLSYGFVNVQRVRENQFTSELRLSSPESSRVSWVGGLYYYNSDLSSFAELTNQGIINNQPNLKTSSYAAFADATVPVGQSLRFLGGIRYTNDHKTQKNTTVIGGGRTVGPFDGELNSNAVNFRLGAQYDLTTTAMLYATYSTGYKAGGFIPDEPGFNTFKPERLRSAEGGIKTRFFDNRLQFNLAGFYYSYDNYQVSTLGVARYGGLSALVFNSQGKTKVYGAEVQVSYRPTKNDVFDLSLSPLKSRFGQFVIPAVTAAGPNGPIIVSPEIDVTGKRIPSAPGLSGTLSYEHNWRMESGRVSARVDGFFSTNYWSEFSHAAFSLQPGYTRTDLSLTYFGRDDGWSIGAFIKNLENSWIVALKANTPSGGDYGLQPPRTYGLTLSVRR